MEAPIPTTQALLKTQQHDHRATSTCSSTTRPSPPPRWRSSGALGVPEDRFNVNGGAVALGHPIGCSGARVLTTLIYALQDRGKRTGLATLCLGGGNAVSMVVRSGLKSYSGRQPPSIHRLYPLESRLANPGGQMI